MKLVKRQVIQLIVENWKFQANTDSVQAVQTLDTIVSEWLAYSLHNNYGFIYLFGANQTEHSMTDGLKWQDQ